MRSSFSTTINHRARRSRRILIVLAVLLLAVFGLPGVAAADPPSSSTSSGADLFCETDTGFFGINVFQEPGGEGPFLDVFFESFEEPFGVFGFTEEFAFDGSTLSAEVEMFLQEFNGDGEENGNHEPEPVGVAIIEAEWTPAGEPEVFMDRFRDGNRWIEFHDTYIPADTAGSAVLEGFFDIDLSECGGSLFESVFWTTNPSAYNNRFRGHFLECALEGPDGSGFLFSVIDDFASVLDVVILPFEGPELFGYTEEFTLTSTQVSATVDLFDGMMSEPAAEAVVSGALESLGISASDLVFQNGTVKLVEESFDVAGTVSVNGSEFEMVECFSASFSERVHFSDPKGPKPEGKTPVNDAPEGALGLEDRGTTNAQTNGAANAPEAACTILFEPENGENGEEPFEEPMPIGKTLWYTFEGTGGEVTVDSAGSNFDTILGIYDGEMNQVVCVDDVGDETGFSLQAAATIETEVGETYYVQIGGFGFFEEEGEIFLGEFGRIRLNLS